jgi:hypothetical protein
VRNGEVFLKTLTGWNGSPPFSRVDPIFAIRWNFAATAPWAYQGLVEAVRGGAWCWPMRWAAG